MACFFMPSHTFPLRHSRTHTMTPNKYIALYADDSTICIHTTDDEEAAWLAQELATDYNIDLVNLLPIHDC